MRMSSKSSIYYAVYDITENKIRDNVIQILKDSSLVRIQKSVFCGKLTSQEKKDLMEKIKIVIEDENDSFYLIMSCSSCFGNIITLGKSFDYAYVSNIKPSIVL